jgi:hypothetical protein
MLIGLLDARGVAAYLADRGLIARDFEPRVSPLVFIDEATYATRFSQDPTVNVTGPGAACSNVGMATQTFPQ